jgi:hypothetical protein
VRGTFTGLKKDRKHASIKPKDWHEKDRPVELTIEDFVNRLKDNPDMTAVLLANVPEQEEAEIPDRVLTGAVSKLPYRKAAVGPSYNLKIRVGALRDDPSAAARSTLNAAVERSVNELMDSEAIEYFQEDDLEIFVAVLRDVAGDESSLDTYGEETEDYEKFQRVSLIRSLHRLLNETLRERYSSTFFKNEQILGEAEAQEAAEAAFVHNSNRSRMSVANLTALRQLVHTKERLVKIAFKTKMDELQEQERLAAEAAEAAEEDSDASSGGSQTSSDEGSQSGAYDTDESNFSN